MKDNQNKLNMNAYQDQFYPKQTHMLAPFSPWNKRNGIYKEFYKVLPVHKYESKIKNYLNIGRYS